MQESDKNIERILQAAEQILAGKKVTVKLDPDILSAIKQLVNKREVSADPRFKKTLDKKIKKTLQEISKQRTQKNFTSLKEKVMKYFLVFLSGAFATSIIAIVVMNQLDIISFPGGVSEPKTPISQDTQVNAELGILGGESIVEVSHKDFGDVPALDEVVAQDAGKVSSDAVATAPMGLGGGGGYAERSYIPYPGGDLYPPEVEYSYSGDKNVSVPQSMGIFRTKKTTVAASRLQVLMSEFGVNFQNLLKDGGFVLNYMNFYSDATEQNYNIDFNSGSISFYINQEYNPNRKNPTEKDIPTDQVLIGIANKYLRDHGIDPSTLNSPEVDKRWEEYYIQEKKMMEESGQNYPMYIPTTMTVVYPKQIEGIQVVDFGGGKIGDVRIDIDIIDKKVMSGSINLNTSYEKTEYPAQNISTIISILEETGGTNGFQFGPTPLRLDIPENDLKPASIKAAYEKAELAYVEKYHWSDGGSKIYYIPVVMFKGKVTNSELKEPYDQTTFVPVISSKNF